MNALTQRLSALLQRDLSEKCSSASYAIMIDGQIIAEDSMGRNPIRGGTYNVGSISKVYCAVAVMQLAERGLVELDRPVWRIPPLLLDAGRAVQKDHPPPLPEPLLRTARHPVALACRQPPPPGRGLLRGGLPFSGPQRAAQRAGCLLGLLQRRLHPGRDGSRAGQRHELRRILQAAHHRADRRALQPPVLPAQPRLPAHLHRRHAAGEHRPGGSGRHRHHHGRPVQVWPALFD